MTQYAEPVEVPPADSPAGGRAGESAPADVAEGLNHVWQGVLRYLAHDPSISRASYATWLGGTVLLRVEGCTYVVGAPHSFARDRLERTYRAAVGAAIGRQCGDSRPNVVFEVAGRPSARARRRHQPIGGRSALNPGAVARVLPSAEPAAAVAPGETAAGPSDGARGAFEETGALAVAGSPAPLGAQDEVLGLPLSPRLTFASFVVGQCNQFAYAASRAVAENPGVAYNPLYLYGASGLGKTHLLHAIGNQLGARRPGAVVVYTPAVALTAALQSRANRLGPADARRSLLGIDALLVDDAQRLGQALPDGQLDGSVGSAGSVEANGRVLDELLAFFDSLRDLNCQVVIAADRAPYGIAGLDGRLRSRLQSGLVAGIAPLDTQTRRALVRARAASLRVVLPSSALEALERSPADDARAIEGQLAHLAAATEFGPPPPQERDAHSAQQLSIARAPASWLRPAEVLAAVAAESGVPIDALRGRRRDREVALPRQVAMYLVRDLCQVSFAEVGALLGGRDHTTILHGCKAISALAARDERVRAFVGRVRHTLMEQRGGAARLAAAV
jgi:chromosomal replication initiator protein